ncbi:hypothetical protein YSA_10954 [Pseudomonas putida ND6]|uniref:Uncharacterized protein n=1 Tax=Pseudomonas putida ND6 TaxID=231023 RepID=I3V4N9_PSEPU|nr:hypothetical protein YSA_10954 [Pseudomonas putida ND6]
MMKRLAHGCFAVASIGAQDSLAGYTWETVPLGGGMI